MNDFISVKRHCFHRGDEGDVKFAAAANSLENPQGNKMKSNECQSVRETPFPVPRDICKENGQRENVGKRELDQTFPQHVVAPAEVEMEDPVQAGAEQDVGEILRRTVDHLEGYSARMVQIVHELEKNLHALHSMKERAESQREKYAEFLPFK